MDVMVITEDAAAEALTVSPRTLQRWRIQGRGPKFIKLGKRVAYTEAALRAYLDQSERQSTSQGH